MNLLNILDLHLNMLVIFLKKSIEIFNESKSQLKIKDLAEKVGYTSSITYINNFKKIYKTSPGKYFGVLDI